MKLHRLFLLSKFFIFALCSPSSIAKMAKNGLYNVQIQIQKECFGLLKDVLFMCVYVPPTGSPYYSVTGTDDGIGLLEECLAEVQLSSDVHVLLCGDLNARTANTPYEVNSSFQLLDIHCHKDTN